jgi:hypothetical protein
MSSDGINLDGVNRDLLSDAIIVFMHDFTDSYYIYNNLIFDSFWDWADVTLATLISSGARFYIRPHPNQSSLSKEYLTKFLVRYASVPVLDARIPIRVLAKSGMKCGVTVYGTIANELAYYNIPTLVAGYGQPYMHFDFAIKPRSIDGYIRSLRELGSVCHTNENDFQGDAIRFHASSYTFASREDYLIFSSVWKRLSCASKDNVWARHLPLDAGLIRFSNTDTWRNFLDLASSN